jgi:hypothetical protein
MEHVSGEPVLRPQRASHCWTAHQRTAAAPIDMCTPDPNAATNRAESGRHLHKFLLETDNLPEISSDLREMIEEEWPELVYSCRPKNRNARIVRWVRSPRAAPLGASEALALAATSYGLYVVALLLASWRSTRPPHAAYSQSRSADVVAASRRTRVKSLYFQGLWPTSAAYPAVDGFGKQPKRASSAASPRAPAQPSRIRGGSSADHRERRFSTERAQHRRC